MNHTQLSNPPSQLWDLNMDSKPVETYHVHEYLRSKLCSLYENDCIFDKFEVVWGGPAKYPFKAIFHFTVVTFLYCLSPA